MICSKSLKELQMFQQGAMLEEIFINFSHRFKRSLFFIVLILVLCSPITEAHEALDNTLPNFEFEYELFSSDNYNQPCEAFFYEYVAAAGNFTHCILLRAKPFRICTKCFEHYAIMKSLYNDLTVRFPISRCVRDGWQICCPIYQRN